jgi:hypothetical protein
MKRSYSICMVLAVVSFTFVTRIMLYTEQAPSAWWMYSLCGIVGIICSYFLVVSFLVFSSRIKEFLAHYSILY